MTKGYVILLTATIDTKGISNMERSDVDDRVQDYRDALNRWKSTGYRIIFCENSGYDLTELENQFKDSNIEFLSFDGQYFDRELGKGFGEQITIDYAISNSQSLSQNDFLIKINGRYFVPNLNEIVKSFNSFENTVDVSSALRLYDGFADSRFFIFNVSFYKKYLSNHLVRINDSVGYYFEHALADSILESMISSKSSWRHLAINPIIVGISGTNGKAYQTNFWHRIKGIILYRLKNLVLAR